MLKIVIWIALLIAILGMIGCAPQAKDAAINTPLSIPTVSDIDISAQVNGNNTFAFNIYQKIKDSNSNVFYSPYSISSALAMTYAGARGDTAKQMASSLHFDLPENVLHAAMHSLQKDLEERNKSKTSQLSIANALWGQKGEHFLPGYIQQINDYYNGAFTPLDFVKATEQSRKEINQWVSDKTNNRINEMLKSGDIDKAIVLVITNAVYFKAPWRSLFRSDTTDDTFYTLDGNSIMVPMMKHDILNFKYSKGDDYQAIDLPYKDSDISMLIILPDNGQFITFENSLDNTKLDSILGSLKDTAVILRMPKFKYESNYLLNNSLKALGMINAFGNADFTAMTDTPGLFIDKVLHSTFISVDENGIEASGGVGVIMAKASGVNMVINRPFIFLIRDKKTGTIMFIGRVLDPKF